MMDHHFEAGELQILDDTEEIEIETVEPHTSALHRVPVWVVVVNGEAYVRSTNGEQGHWYFFFNDTATTEIYTDERRIPIRATPVVDPEVLGQVSDAYCRKYTQYPQDVAWIIGTVAQLTTLRLKPRDRSDSH